MIGEATASEVVVDSEISELKIIPSRVELIGFEVEMMSDPFREKILKSVLDNLKNLFEYIIT